MYWNLENKLTLICQTSLTDTYDVLKCDCLVLPKIREICLTDTYDVLKS